MIKYCYTCKRDISLIDQLYNAHKCGWKPKSKQDDSDDSVKKNIEWFHEKGMHYPYHDCSGGVGFFKWARSYVNRHFEFRNVLTVLMWEISYDYPGSVVWDEQKITYEDTVITFGQLGTDFDKNIKITILYGGKIYSCGDFETVLKVVKGIIDEQGR